MSAEQGAPEWAERLAALQWAELRAAFARLTDLFGSAEWARIRAALTAPRCYGPVPLAVDGAAYRRRTRGRRR